MIRAIQHNQHLLAGTNENVNTQETGLVSGHCYSILSVHEIKDAKGGIHRLIQMKNPWGYGEWTGEWSDDSPLWTPQIKSELGVEEAANDGIFFIPLDKFHKYFCATSITVEMDKQKYKSTNYNYDFASLKTGEFFKFEIKEPINLA